MTKEKKIAEETAPTETTPETADQEKVEAAPSAQPETKTAPALFASMQKIQAQLQTVGKNKSGHNSRYADIEQIWEKVGQIIRDNGFIVTNAAEATGVRTIAIHEDGNSLQSFIPFSKAELKPQEKGSEITYYRRYNLTAIFNIIVAGEDDDADKATGKPKDFTKPEIDIVGASKKLRSAKNLDELKIFWKGLTNAERGDSEIEAVKEEMKGTLTE